MSRGESGYPGHHGSAPDDQVPLPTTWVRSAFFSYISQQDLPPEDGNNFRPLWLQSISREAGPIALSEKPMAREDFRGRSARHPFCLSPARRIYPQVSRSETSFLMKSSEPPAVGDVAGPESVWQELEMTCDEAIQASRHVGACLERGVGTAEFVPLLRRELELARSIQTGIARLRAGGGSPPGEIAAARGRFARRLAQLLDLEGDNRRQLSRRGVVINGLPARADTRRKPRLPR